VNAQTPVIQISNLNKEFPSKHGRIFALKAINLEVFRGEFICLLGPSGCGKSTLLNVVAGFSEPTSGIVIANGKSISEPGPDRAMVFQEYALFPWMTVYGNVAFGLELAGKAKSATREIVHGWLQKLQLQDFQDRFPKDLSGGMRQRVAIARALAIDSPMLLMDEPFGALDALTRRNLQDELLRIWQELKKTILFVTHGIDESVYLADRVIVMTYRPGQIKRIVPVDLSRPRDPNSAEFNALERRLGDLVAEEQRQRDLSTEDFTTEAPRGAKVREE
jgi:NitT/TauT family transport system ATP-binding protein